MKAINKMMKYRQISSNDKEAGGILIGRILIENEHYIIDDVSLPMPNDIRKRNRFTRNTEGHQEFFDSIWLRENGRCFYLGEWHTHPENIPNPSSIDYNNWDRILNLKFESNYLFFIIIGVKRMNVWLGNRFSGELLKLDEEGFYDREES